MLENSTEHIISYRPEVKKNNKNSLVRQGASNNFVTSFDTFETTGGELKDENINDENLFSKLCVFVSDTVKKVISSLDPFISFLQKIDLQKDPLTANELEDVVDDFAEAALGGKIELSDETKKAVSELTQAIRVIEGDDELKNMDLRELIKKWRNSEDAKCLIEMAKRIQEGKCVPITNEKLKELFIKSLHSLSSALMEAKKNGGYETAHELKKVANPVVNSIERVQERGGDSNLTVQDKKDIATWMEESKNHVEQVTHDDYLSSFLSTPTRHELERLYDFFTWFLDEWHEMIEEEEKKECERKCEEREKKEEEAQRLHALHKKKEMEKYIYKAMARRALEEMFVDSMRRYYFALSKYEELKKQENAIRSEEASVEASKPLPCSGDINDIILDFLNSDC
ncbi:MAG: hypothetical protein HYY52_05875 [Candidatus Melainabacteria bacterium]|nr:hypothetical protein [Candidatus Melainabacteria bacterium]